MRAIVETPTASLLEKMLYRIPEVAAQLNISRSKVYELLQSGRLPSVHIDRTRLIRRSDLLHYIDSSAPTG